jgi:hypothetical protein
MGPIAPFMPRDRRPERSAPVRCSVSNCPKLATILDGDQAFCGEHAPDPPNVVAAQKRGRQ